MRNQRLKVFFAFMLGVALTAMLFSAAWMEVGWCTAGNPCTSSEQHLRRVLNMFRAGAPPPSATSTVTPVGIVPTTSSAKLYFSKEDGNARANREGGSHTATARLSVTQLPSTRPRRRENEFKKGRTKPPALFDQHPTESSTYSIPKLKFGQRTFPVPSEPPSMVERLPKPCPQTDLSCRDNLSPTEDQQYSKCIKKCEKQTAKFGAIKNSSCHFMDGTGRLPVALASFPGAGNTWTRGLLEKVTGVCTGSLYCDCSLRAGGFTGEGMQGPSVLAVKTHNLKVQFVGGHVFGPNRLPYGGAILLVRDPRGALVAEWNRERSKRMVSPNVSNHFAYVREEYFGDNELWEKYIHLKLPRWPQQTVYLLQEARFSRRPVYILLFEDLKANTVREMKRVTDFLGFSLTEEEVAQRLGAGFSKFYRNHTSSFAHFTTRQERYISNVVSSTSQYLKDNGLYDMFPRIDEYL